MKGKSKSLVEHSVFVISSLFLALPKIHVIIPNNTIREGDSVNLTCIVDAGFPESQIRWTKYSTLRGQSNAICLTRVTTKDQVRYTCEAVNSGRSSSDSIYVKVQGNRNKEFSSCILGLVLELRWGSSSKGHLIIILTGKSGVMFRFNVWNKVAKSIIQV